MGRKVKVTPAKSELHPQTGSANLLRVALTRSAATRRESKRRENESSILSDLSNVSDMTSANSTLNNTQARKIAALAKIKQLDMEITPRTALKEFNQANQSDAQTPALFMGTKPTRKRKADTSFGLVKPDSQDTEEEDLSSDDSSLDVVGKRRSLRSSRSHAITVDDIDPEKDLIKPTSFSVRVSEDSLLLNNTEDETIQVVKTDNFLQYIYNYFQARKRRTKTKTQKFSLTDFDITQAKKFSTTEASMSTLEDSTHDDSQTIIEEESQRRRNMMEKRNLRKAQRHNWDFSSLEPPAPLPEIEEEEDETPVVTKPKRSKRNPITASDFQDITLTVRADTAGPSTPSSDNQQEHETLVATSSMAPANNSLSISKHNSVISRKSTRLNPDKVDTSSSQVKPTESTYEDTDISTGDLSVAASLMERSRRKSVYQAGLNSTEKPLVLEQTVVFRPETESTRIGNMSNASLLTKSPPLRDPSHSVAKPGRDTSTPFTKSLRQQGLSKTVLVNVNREEVVGRGSNQTIDPNLPTPQIIEVVRHARKSGLKSMKLSLYQSSLPEDITETGCQVTPGLGEGPNLINSLTEEVNIDLPQDDEYYDGENELHISGRKNPSPITERRNEFDNAEKEEENDNVMSGFMTVVENTRKGSEDIEDDELERNEEQDNEQTEVDGRAEKDMRQASLGRYFVNRATASPSISPLSSPQKAKENPKQKTRQNPRNKNDSKLIFPAKQIKFEFQRFSRYKLKSDADQTLVKASENFLNEALKKMSGFAGERRAEKIHLCDIKRLMAECKFIPIEKDDPKERFFHQAINEIARFEHVKELIPCNLGRGEIYPPKDCWELKGGKEKKNKRSK